MKLDNLFQLCFYFCLVIVIFMVSINIVNSLHLFAPISSGISTAGKTPENIFTEITGFSGGMEYIWIGLLSATGFIVLVIVKITQSTTMIGVYLLSAVFWTSFTKFASSININNWIPSEMMTAIIVGSLFIWVGAIISLLTGD
jgi:hypothetical protein